MWRPVFIIYLFMANLGSYTNNMTSPENEQRTSFQYNEYAREQGQSHILKTKAGAISEEVTCNTWQFSKVLFPPCKDANLEFHKQNQKE